MRTVRIAALALIAALAGSPALAQAPQTGAAPAAQSAPKAAASPKAALVDINTATKDELDALPGIGPVRAEAIIKGRPYTGKDELLRKKVLPENVYKGIHERIIARQS